MSKSAPEILNFAIIGCGNISRKHALAISELPEAKLVAVCNVAEEKAQKLAREFPAEIYTSYEELLKRNDIDVVIVLTPSGTHGEIGIAVARAGKHVIVEKPMEVNLEKAKALEQACRENQRKLSVISQHRFDPAIQDLKAAVDAGKLGRLNFGGSHTKWYRDQEYYDSGAWRGTWALDGGGALINQSIHYVDLLQYIMGPVAEVSAYCVNRAHERIEVEDIAVAAVKFQSGAVGLIEGNTSAYPGFCTRLDIYGSDGSVIIENDCIKEWRLRGEESTEKGSREVTVKTAVSSPDVLHTSHQKQIQDMIQAIKEDREPQINGAEGLKSLAIVLAIYESARTGRPVSL